MNRYAPSRKVVRNIIIICNWVFERSRVRLFHSSKDSYGA